MGPATTGRGATSRGAGRTVAAPRHDAEAQKLAYPWTDTPRLFRREGAGASGFEQQKENWRPLPVAPKPIPGPCLSLCTVSSGPAECQADGVFGGFMEPTARK